MHFLPDVYVPCDVCKGQRYNRETLEIRYRGKNIHEVLEMTVEDWLRFLANVPTIASKLTTLNVFLETAAEDRALELAEVQYREGVTSYLTVLDAQRSQLQAKDALLAAQRDVLRDVVALEKALAGGWE